MQVEVKVVILKEGQRKIEVIELKEGKWQVNITCTESKLIGGRDVRFFQRAISRAYLSGYKKSPQLIELVRTRNNGRTNDLGLGRNGIEDGGKPEGSSPEVGTLGTKPGKLEVKPGKSLGLEASGGKPVTNTK